MQSSRKRKGGVQRRSMRRRKKAVNKSCGEERAPFLQKKWERRTMKEDQQEGLLEKGSTQLIQGARSNRRYFAGKQRELTGKREINLHCGKGEKTHNRTDIGNQPKIFQGRETVGGGHQQYYEPRNLRDLFHYRTNCRKQS